MRKRSKGEMLSSGRNSETPLQIRKDGVPRAERRMSKDRERRGPAPDLGGSTKKASA